MTLATDITIFILYGTIVCVFFYFILELFGAWRKKRLLKKYDAEKNLSRREPPESIGGKREHEETTSSVAGSKQPREQELLQTTETSIDGKGSASSRKDSRRVGRIRNRLKKKSKKK